MRAHMPPNALPSAGSSLSRKSDDFSPAALPSKEGEDTADCKEKPAAAAGGSLRWTHKNTSMKRGAVTSCDDDTRVRDNKAQGQEWR